VNAQRLGDAGSEALGLHQHGGQRLQRGGAGPLTQFRSACMRCTPMRVSMCVMPNSREISGCAKAISWPTR
jgi:hypothetical protein